jgi:hypothetical protein
MQVDPNKSWDEMTDAERQWILHGDPKPPCDRCGGSGWLDAIGPKADGSYITARPCHCNR